MVIVLIGVSASGKTTVGKYLAQQLHWQFFDGDDFHSPVSIEKMRRGIPLTDADREPWLNTIRETICAAVDQGKNAVIACSAMKRAYRQILQVDRQVVFVYLKADIVLIRERSKNRAGHFMDPALVQSQFDALEEPQGALEIEASLSPGEIVQLIRSRLSV